MKKKLPTKADLMGRLTSVKATTSDSKIKVGIDATLAEWRPTWRGDLIDIGEELRARILTVISEPKPDYRLKDDTYSWGDYLDILMKSYGAIQGLLVDLDEFEYKRPYWYRAQHRSHYRRYF